MGLKSEKSNNELVRLLQKGDMTAFDAIYQQYGRRVSGFVFRYIKQEADVEEIVQEVFVKIWVNRHKLDADASFESYLFTITYNTIISIIRKRVNEKKYVEHVKSLQRHNYVDNTIDDIQYKDLNTKVDLLLNQLTPRQKEIFLLSREQGLTHKEIAAKLNISSNTVKNHLVTTLSFLKSKLAKEMILGVLYVSLFL